jgi:site-specific recombinase
VDILDKNEKFDTMRFVDFFRMLVRNENRMNSIREFLSQCLGYIAYQIAEHKGSKGDKYITTTWTEYRAMLASAMRGGFVICFVAIIKNLLTRLEMPPFWHGVAYSVNYSIGFVVIEETHSTLATKQPAFTASAVASSLDTKKNIHQPNLYNLAVTVAKVSRSQIASFIGNLVVVFPGTFLLAWLYFVATGSKIVEGDKARALLESQHPWHSLSLLYACNAGFFLFLSGIIAGYVQNKIQYSHIGERLLNHPFLQFSMPAQRLRKFSRYIEKHAGALIGNIALGFMLGMASVVTNIFGLGFDIRHITISAGNVAIGVYGLGVDHINPWYLLTIFLGVLGIGFFNFLVSFSLAFIVAVKSRGVRLKDYPEFIGILTRYFFRKPLSFIRPPRSQPELE